MKLDQIQIRTQDARVDLNISDSNQYIKQNPAQQSISQPAATIQMSHTNAKLSIDSSQARYDIGLLSPKESVAEYARKGKQAVMEGIARKVSEGNQLMAIENKDGANILANIAKSHDTFTVQKIGIKFIPSFKAVKITYQAGDLNIHTQVNKPQIDVQLGDVIHEFTPSIVSGNLIQRESVETTVIKGE